MRGQNTWSYHPYRPFLTDVGEIYICRIVPEQDRIHFEWISEENRFSVYYRVRNGSDFYHWCDTEQPQCDITSLSPETDYEFYVTAGEKKSRIRLARCGECVVGTVVNYLHPDDEAYAFSGRYLCSPSLVRHPDGYLLASMDLFGGLMPQNLTLIFRSDDEGESWHYVSELMPCFWGKLFIHKGELYMLSCSTEYGDLLIGKSTDGGRTFSAPVVLFRGSNGKNGNTGFHKNPQNILHHNGRIYTTVEWGAWANTEFCHAAMVLSCDAEKDLLIPENWNVSAPRKFDHFAPELSDLPNNTMTIEGTLVLSPESELLNVMRFGKYAHAIVYRVDTEDPDAPLSYFGLMKFPANYSKFMIKYDPTSSYYYTLASRVLSEEEPFARNLLSMMRSKDLKQWDTVLDVFDYRDRDPKQYGFQYVDFEMEGDDILLLCRTAINGAYNFHDSNYSIFRRIEHFRNYVLPIESTEKHRV